MTNPTALPEPLLLTPGSILPLFIAAIRVLATTQDFTKVSQPLAGLIWFQQEDWIADGGASFRFEDDSVEEISLAFARSGSGALAPSHPQVIAMQAILNPDTVRLGELEEILGPWYRDPPDGDEVSYACAYFNARSINPNASFFLVATTKEPYSKTLPASAFVEQLAVTWNDDRYKQENRPW
jgi:hypothetical protein